MKKENDINEETCAKNEKENEVNSVDLKVELEKSEQKLNEALKQADEYKNKLLYTMAEFDNYKKRTLSQSRISYLDGKAEILTKIFAIGDNLDRALQTCKEETTKNGLEMVLKSFSAILTNEGISEINPINQEFDPTDQEAIMTCPCETEEEDNKVKQVYVKGYKREDKVLRFAQVIVAKKQ